MIPPPSFLNPWMRDKVRAPWRTQAGFHCLLASQSHQPFSHFLVFSRMVNPPPHLLPPGLSLRVLLPLPGMPPSPASADCSLDLSSSAAFPGLPCLFPPFFLGGQVSRGLASVSHAAQHLSTSDGS